MSLTSGEVTTITRELEDLEWRTRRLAGQTIRAWPPGGGAAIDITPSRDPRARANTYARFRRHGVELDPNRQKRRVLDPCTAQPVPLAKLIRQAPLPDDLGSLDVQAVKFSPHAAARMEERRISIVEVWATLAHPHVVRQDTHDLDRFHYLRGDIEVIYKPDPMQVITVIDRIETQRTTPRIPLYYTDHDTTDLEPSSEGEGEESMASKPAYKPDIVPFDGMAATVTAVLQFCDLMFEVQPEQPWQIRQLRDMFLPSRQFNEDALMQQLRRRVGDTAVLEGNRQYRIVKPPDSLEKDGMYACVPIEPAFKPDIDPFPGMSASVTAILMFTDEQFAHNPGGVWLISELKKACLPSRQFTDHALAQVFSDRVDRPLPDRDYRIVRPPNRVYRDGKYMCVAVTADTATQPPQDPQPQQPAATVVHEPTELVPRQRAGELVASRDSLRVLTAKWNDGNGPAATTAGPGGNTEEDYVRGVAAMLKANPGRELTVTYHEIDLGGADQVWMLNGSNGKHDV